MSLSTKAKESMKIALASKELGQEVSDSIDASTAKVSAAVAALGTTTDLTGVDGTGNNAADLATTEARLDAIEAKVDEIIAALKAAGLMAS